MGRHEGAHAVGLGRSRPGRHRRTDPAATPDPGTGQPAAGIWLGFADGTAVAVPSESVPGRALRQVAARLLR